MIAIGKSEACCPGMNYGQNLVKRLKRISFFVNLELGLVVKEDCKRRSNPRVVKHRDLSANHTIITESLSVELKQRLNKWYKLT